MNHDSSPTDYMSKQSLGVGDEYRPKPQKKKDTRSKDVIIEENSNLKDQLKELHGFIIDQGLLQSKVTQYSPNSVC
jgi:hypothetical protein